MKRYARVKTTGELVLVRAEAINSEVWDKPNGDLTMNFYHRDALVFIPEMDKLANHEPFTKNV